MNSKKLSRRDFLRASAAGAAGLAALASGINVAGAMPASRKSRRQGPVTVTLIDPWAATSFGDAQNAQIQRFMDSHPNIVIERSDVNFNDFRQLLIQGAAAGE